MTLSTRTVADLILGRKWVKQSTMFVGPCFKKLMAFYFSFFLGFEDPT